MKYTLRHHPIWTPHPHQPQVYADICRTNTHICVTFDVCEHPEFFRATCQQDGDPCWQDSCVEIFLKSGGGYYNFECNSAGYCLAEFGQSRTPRKRLDTHQYAQIKRQCIQTPQTLPDGRIHWILQVQIPYTLIQLTPDAPIIGNLYKCASYAQTPNYLSAFPIDTPTPDFHRPEFFQTLLPGTC